ncbi:MAG: DUF4381 family protein [Pseudomonadota bacterium]
MKRQRILIIQPLLIFGAIPVLAADPGKETLTLQKNPKQQTTSQDTVLHDIHGPLPTSEYPPYLMEAALGLFALLVIALVIYFLKKRKKPLPPPVPPWETALQELAEARQLMGDGKWLLYMDQAGQILRRYIELRFAIRSTRQTTREFFAGLNASGSASLLKYQGELRACLEQADMAKFAHLVPNQNHMEQMEEAVRTFIISSRPEEQTAGSRS